MPRSGHYLARLLSCSNVATNLTRMQQYATITCHEAEDHMKLFIVPVLLLVLFLFTGCSDSAPPEPSVATINEYAIPLSDFETQLADAMEYDESFKLTDASRQAFLEELIRKELLIQEAKRLALDREEKFVASIERYWEATLIRNLIDRKGVELSRGIIVSEEEIAAYYENNAAFKEGGIPLPEAHDTIRDTLREKKKSLALQAWIDDLRSKAAIEVKEELLYRK